MTSTVKVNTLTVASGCTMTLGESGKTVALASGATQTGFGRTGTVDWVTDSIKTATFTAVSGKGYFCNTTGGAFEVDLPAGSAGSIVSIQDYNNTFDTYALTVDPNGTEKINGGAGSIILNSEGEGVTLVYIDATVGWRSIQDSAFSDVGSDYMVATGGTITTSGNDKIHTFTGPGTFTVSVTAACATNNLVSYGVVAGGGGGGGGSSGSDNSAGGGGAGGFRELVSPSAPYTASPLNGYPTPGNRITVTATGYPITVGAGGATQSSADTQGNDGSVSTFSSISSAGGGGGASAHPSPSRNGRSGGSGGGSSGGTSPASTGGAGNTPPVSPAQGFRGGNYCTSSPDHASPGGGGATATGFDKPGGIAGLTGGPGGSGATTSISGTSTGYAGGGGGGAGVCGTVANSSEFPNGRSPAPGTAQDATLGFGGADGGKARSNGGGAGTANKGGGGGAGGGMAPGGPSTPSIFSGGAGGSGIVIIRYKYQ